MIGAIGYAIGIGTIVLVGLFGVAAIVIALNPPNEWPDERIEDKGFPASRGKK